MNDELVIVNEQRYKVIEGVLNLQRCGIQDITDIEGLGSLTNLKKLNHNDNKISEIRDLETFINLEFLKLSGNQVIEIKGLEALTSLIEFDLTHNLKLVNECLNETTLNIITYLET